MALTAQQATDVRRYMGYSVSGNTTSVAYRELVYSNVAFASLSLDYRLANLTAEEEGTIVDYFLANLKLREQELQDASANLDTDVAAVWTHNKNEIRDRRSLFTALRLELCHFLGYAPGAAIAQTNRVVRA